MKKIILIGMMFMVLLALIVAPAFSQDSTAVQPLLKQNGFLPFVKNNWLSIILFLSAIYDAAISIFPTVKDWSILSNIYKFIRLFIPNNNTKGGTHKV